MESQEPPSSDNSEPQIPNPNNNNNNNNNKKLKMVCAELYIPKDDAETPDGDDANFVCEEGETIGVADGVGGWWKFGVDPGEYSRQLMGKAAESVSRAAKLGQAVNPLSVLSEAHAQTTAEGSSTACIVTHRGGGVLRAANVGDSGFAVFRNNKAVFRSESQQRSFNHPYQLSRDGGETQGPEIAAEIETAVEESDVIVLGTDGLWDNVFTRDVEMALESVGGNINRVVDLKRLVCDVTNMAWCHSQFNLMDTPFSLASNLAGRDFEGGKPDDITVIVAQIIKVPI